MGKCGKVSDCCKALCKTEEEEKEDDANKVRKTDEYYMDDPIAQYDPKIVKKALAEVRYYYNAALSN